jgi:hypothetical protein
MTHTTVYVYLLDEGVDAWRPVSAHHVGTDVYQLAPAPEPPMDEKWEFPPGTRVICELRHLDGPGPDLVACRLAS